MMNFVKTSSTISSPTADHNQAHYHKSKSKFMRSQEPQKSDKKKVQIKLKEEDRICFISPNKLKVTSQFTKEINKVSSTQSLNKPQLFHQESIIQSNHCNNIDQASKMNDSLLSMYDQLSNQNQRKREADIFLLRKQLENMKIIVEEQRLQKNVALDKLKDIQYLQHFLMERESYICSITEKNIILNQKLVKTQQQRQSMQRELVYLRNTYQLSLKKYHQQLTELKSKCSTLAHENKALKKTNAKLKLHIQEFFVQNNQSTTVMESFITENQHKTERAQARNCQLKSKNEECRVQPLSTSNLFLNRDELNQQNSIKHALSYKQLHSSRSNRLKMERSFEYDYNDDKKMATCNRDCACGFIIDRLNQKLRYNLIEIDILKRMKGKGEFVESDNQKLKKQVKSLTQRIEYLTDKKKQKKKRLSDSPLELSLSPKKQSKNHK